MKILPIKNEQKNQSHHTNPMYIIDWITCCCYMLLRKCHYSEWDAKFTAILNSSVVLGFLLVAINDIVLQLTFPGLLFKLYHYGKVYWFLMHTIAMVFIALRYYCLCKDAIPLQVAHLKENGPHNGWILLPITASILIGSIAIGFFVSQYTKSQGIVFNS